MHNKKSNNLGSVRTTAKTEIDGAVNSQEYGPVGKADLQRLLTQPGKINPNTVLNLQRKYGNQTVMRLLGKTNPAQLQRHPASSGGHHSHEEETEEQAGSFSQVARLPLEGVTASKVPGNIPTLHLTPPAAETATAGAIPGNPVQRLWDTAELTNIAGVPTAGAPKYRAITKALDSYHVKAQELWQKAKKSETFKKELNKVLDNLAKVSRAYFQNFDRAPQVPFLRELVNSEIPAERKRIDGVINREDFTTNDRSQTIGEVKDGQPAKILNAGIGVGETTVVDNDEGGIAQSHSMDVWVDIDAGKEPIKPENAPPNTIYGVSLEYWENVDIRYNFVAKPSDNVKALKKSGEGKISKPWNDIMAMRPDAETFNKKSGPIQISWVNAVNDARGRTLRGVQKIGFTDNPGVTPLTGKYMERILRFRIVLKDSTQQREIFATQKFLLDGQTEPVSKTYVDSKGNAFGKERDANDPTAMNDMAPVDPRIQSHGITPQVLDKSVPGKARKKLKYFVKELVAGTAVNFYDLEATEIKIKIPGSDANMAGPHQAYSRMANKKYNNPTNEFYKIAGMNLLPLPQDGQTYKQYPITGGGLLVAIMEGPEIRRMYYTSNVARTVGAQAIDVRSFAEIPVEEVKPYFVQANYRKSMTGNERTAFDVVKQARVNQLVTDTGVKNNVGVAIAADPSTIQYVIAHPENYDLLESEFARVNTPRKLEDVLKPYFQGEAHANGSVANEYERLHAQIPNAKAWNILRNAFIAEMVASHVAPNGGMAAIQVDQFYTSNRAAYGTVAVLNPLITNNQANRVTLENAIMGFIATNKGKAPSVENDYNTAVAALTPTLTHPQNVPTTLGELVNSFFTREFKVRGKEVDVFADLMAKYPDFQYRIRPMYRLLFGEAQLRHVMQQMRKAHAAAEIPDPGSLANMRAKRAFRNHAPFTMANFATSINNAAKFDTEYNPENNQLKITLKVSFEFVTTSNVQQQVKGNEVGSQYTNTAWDPTSEGEMKANYKKSILDIWNKEARPIQCNKPGWEDIMAMPVFDIQEVTQGLGQNHLKVSKAAMSTQDKRDKTGMKIPDKKNPGNYKKEKALKAGGTSAWGPLETAMQEFDVADKISDPTVHKYLHQGEKTNNIVPAYTTDRSRVENRLNDFGKLEFVDGSATNLNTPDRIQVLAGEMKRLGMPPDISRLHPLVLEGSVNGAANKSLSKKRAAAVERLLKAEGITNPMTLTVGPNDFEGVRVKAGPVDTKIADTYVTKWQRITAAHEFGHMLGLMDEYYSAKSDEVVKKMIGDGLLPPETRGDHLTATPLAGPEKATENERSGQEATMKLLEANDLDTPDFTLKDSAKSTSIMTGGYELWSQHFVTVWEALAKLTEADIESKYWKIA